MAELTPGQHQAKRTARIKGLPAPTPPPQTGGIKSAPASPRMPPPGLGQLPPAPPVGVQLGQPPRMPPISVPQQPGVQALPGGQGMPPWAPGPQQKPQSYTLATLMEGAKTGGLPPVGRQFPGGPMGGPSPVVGDAGLIRKNQLQSQALAPQFG